MRKFSCAAGALCLSLTAGSAQGAITFSFFETGGDVVGTLTGALDLTDAALLGDGSVLTGINPSKAAIGLAGDVDIYEVSGPADFGTGGLTSGGIATGDAFAILGDAGLLGIKDGTSSGDPLGGRLIFRGVSFATLGVRPGSYVYSLPHDTVTISFSPSVIPLPATLPLLLGAVGLAFAATRRRRA